MYLLSRKQEFLVLLTASLGFVRLTITWEFVTTTSLHPLYNEHDKNALNTSAIPSSVDTSWFWIPDEEGSHAKIPRVNDTWTPKVWEPVLHRDWCSDESTTRNPGLIYLKIPKSSSSTLAGINIRLARSIGSQIFDKEGQNGNTTGVCSHTYRHGHARLTIQNRQKASSAAASSTDTEAKQNPLTWTFLRDPAARQISQFFHFEVSRRNVRYTTRALMAILQNSKNFSYNYVKKSESQVDWGEEVASDNVSISSLPVWYVVQRTAMEPYNFIGLLERREESLAVMKLLWNLTTADLVVLSAKSSGGYDDGRYQETCVQIKSPPRPLPARVSYFIEHGFRRDNWDYLLYAMANATLDKTIQVLGVGRVEREVQQLQRYQRIAEESCLQDAVFPCSVNGTRQVEASSKSCYYNDFGCGYACVDRVLASVSEDED